MAIPYPYTSSTLISTGSYLNQKETQMFLSGSGYGVDVWYGLSETDVIEISAFDLDQNQLGWDTINTEKTYKTVTLSYLDTLDRPTTYSYRELVSDFVLYKNAKILVNPIEQLSSSFGILQGNYILTYNFMREMAGSPSSPLVVKDISPSRKEIKLVPKGNNTARYQAFCQKKFQVKDVAPLLLQLTTQCPYDQIYARVKDQYANEIAFLKQLLFLETDGAFIAFLRTLYEDVVVYTASGGERIKRTQGIRGYYQNFLLSHYENISDFILIDDEYDKFTVLRVEQQFKPYGVQTGENFVKAKKFLVSFFTENFYHPITLSTKAAFDQKYYSYFKNALNLGNNQMFTALDHAYMDEKIQETDPLTLLLKLKDELPDTVKVQTECWVSNISIAPFIVDAIVRNPAFGQTVKIGSANFALEAETISLYNVNESYTAADLRNSAEEQQTIDVNKKINELPVDYTNFSNFVLFSSATQRLVNFKKKTSTWYGLSSSLVTLNYDASQSFVSGTLYPQYSMERGSLESQMSDIVTSFDGYESYLFKTGSYVYNATTATFVSASYVAEQDFTASLYDKANRDSLINNTPDHIVLDEGNNDYLMFLHMVGHFFDNIYLYINNLPSERVLADDPTKTFSKKMVDYMLTSFGWNIGTTDEDLSMVQTYTTNVSSSMSADDRTKAIRTRILNTLPEIYKTKGTEDAVKLLLACYGVPSNLLDIREYGNNDNTTASLVTYTKRERACLLAFSGSGTYVTQSFAPRPNIRTIELKVLFKNSETYPVRQNIFFVEADHIYTVVGSDPVELPSWRIGVRREYGHMGRIIAELPVYVTASMQIEFPSYPRIVLTSSLLPLFDEDIFNIRFRRNEPEPAYQYVSNQELVPSVYDLTVQRNKSGYQVFRCVDSVIGFYEDNMVWDGYLEVGALGITGSLGNTVTQSITFGGTHHGHFYLGNTMVWDIPVSNADFEVHCNDFSSFSYSGSNGEVHLITRMDADEATNFLTQSYSYTVDGTFSNGLARGTIPNKSEYYSTFKDLYGDFVDSGSWTGSRMGLYNKPIMPIEIGYYNDAYYPLNPAEITNNCGTIRWEPEYPYEYLIADIEKVFTTPNYGPNRYKNEKIKSKPQTVAARLDDKDRSTYDQAKSIHADSNLLGLYLDPQDAKNRDIVKYYGNNNLVNLIADPSNMFSASYGDLKDLNEQYNSFGDRRVLYNELITLYKIYFNRSLFDTVKNVVPARASVRTGILVEPTVLERPKYQHHQIAPEMNTGSVMYYDVTASHYAKGPLSSSVYAKDTITKILRFHGAVGNTSDGNMELLYGEFNNDTSYAQTGFDTASLPANPTIDLDLSYLNEANFIYPVNYGGGYITDLTDEIQQGRYASLGEDMAYPGALGVTTHDGGTFTFMVKKWDKYTIYSKSGSYIRHSNKAEDVYLSNSIWLYSLTEMTPDGYERYFYTSSINVLSGSVLDLTAQEDVSIIGGFPYYFHRANTAKNTANERINTIRNYEDHISYTYVLASGSQNIADQTYFEVFGGYPRNHYTHKRMQYSPVKFLSLNGKYKVQTPSIYVRSRQTSDTTIDDKSGLGDASLPVQTIQTSNVNLVKSDNVINQ